MSEYHKIETLYERDDHTHRLKQPLVLKNKTYGLLSSWEWTEKIDGTNIRVMWTPSTQEHPGVRFGGKTDKAQIPSDLVNAMNRLFPHDPFLRWFPVSSVVLYGEGYGAGIQKGGGAYSQTKKFILFDVLVDGKWWLNWTNVCDVAGKLRLDTVPFIGSMSLEDATAMVQQGFKSALGDNPPAEGLVGRPAETLFDKKGARLITKIKTKDF